MIEIVDTISQFAIPLFTLVGMFLIARKVKWGFLLALFAQPFWMFTTYVHGQFGVFFNTVVYTGILLYGAYNWFFGKEGEAEPRIDKVEKTE